MNLRSEQHSILLSGYFGAMNIGDEAILYSTLSELTAPNTKITVESVDPELTVRKHDVDAIPLLSREPITWLTMICEVDELVIGGGGLLEPKNTGKYLLMVLLASIFNTTVSWYCVGVSPTENWIDRWAYRAIIDNSDYTSVRDNGSKKDLERSGVKSHISVIPDPALKSDYLPTSQTDISGSYIAVVVRNCNWQPLNINRLSEALDTVVEETSEQILLVPFEDRYEDWNVIDKLQAAMNEDTEIYSGNISVGTMNDVMANAELVIGMRLHSIILAAANGVNFITLSYSEKCDRIAAQLGDKSPYNCSSFDQQEFVSTALERYHNQAPMQSVNHDKNKQRDLFSERSIQRSIGISERISLVGAIIFIGIFNIIK